MADRPSPKQDETTGRFVPGNSGGPGRPLGARNKLGEAFVEAMQADFNAHGADTIARVRAEKPDQYLKVVASILPKDLNINVNAADEMTDDQLIERIRALDAAIQPYLALEGARGAGGRNGASRRKAERRSEPPQVH